jgi:hypothetical protein
MQLLSCMRRTQDLLATQSDLHASASRRRTARHSTCRHRLDWQADVHDPGGERQLLTRSDWRAIKSSLVAARADGQRSLEAKRVFTMAKDGLSYR